MYNDIPEDEAKKILDDIASSLTDGKGLKRYTRLDLIRFHELAMENKDKPLWSLVKEYTPIMERKSAKEMLGNIMKGLGL